VPLSDPSALDRLLAAGDHARTVFGGKLEQANSVISGLLASGGARGSGALGAGALAKFAGMGGAGKAALACIGVSAAAGACVAAGVVPRIPIPDPLPRHVARETATHHSPHRLQTATSSVPTSGAGDLPPAVGDPVPVPEPPEPADPEPAQEPSTSEPSVESQGTSTVPVVQEEFDPVAAAVPAPVSSDPPPPPPPQQPSSSPGPSTDPAGAEFGP
jgi:hypothetical protein